MSAWLLAKLIERHNIAYLLADRALRITYASAKVDHWLNIAPDQLEGRALQEYFPELVGSEQFISQLKYASQQNFRLERVERTLPDGQARFYDLHMEATPPPNEGFLLLLSDVTEATRLTQHIATQRNELLLAQERLEGVTQKIGYLLEHFVPRGEIDKLVRELALPVNHPDDGEATLLCADLHNFTRLARSLPLEQVLEMLHGCLEEVAGVMETHGGSIIQLDSNLLTVSFNVPLERPEHARQAVLAALQAQKLLGTRFSWWQQGSVLRLGFGFGLSTGCVEGLYLRAGERCQYALIGDAVSQAFELASRAAAGHVLISQATLDRLGAQAQVVPLYPAPGSAPVDPWQVYEVRGLVG